MVRMEDRITTGKEERGETTDGRREASNRVAALPLLLLLSPLAFSDFGELRAHRGDRGLVVLRAENRRSRNEGVRARARDLRDILHLHPAVHLEPDVEPRRPYA